MKKFLLVLLILLTFSFVNVKASDYVSAESYILIEKDSLRVIKGENIDKQLLTASICKILTCIVAIENGNLEEEFIVTKDVISQNGSSIYLQLGEKVKLIDLLYGMMLRSGNDAAYMIAKSVGKNVDNFVIMMNEYAKKIGMKYSVFSNPSGLDDESYNYSTAYDMALLMASALNNDVFKQITSTRKYTFKSTNGSYRSFTNKHKLVTAYDFVTGGKTGDVSNIS